ncbi:MAG: hypothetical protein U0W40_08235 [Acidimicrobiia bacterium]
MRMRNDEEFQLRRFRVALVVIMTWPWLLWLGFVIVGGHEAPTWRFVRLAVDLLLLVAALRKPWGLAPIFIVLWYAFGFLSFLFGPGEDWWWYAITGLELALMVALLVPIWRRFRGHDLARQRARVAAHRERVERAYEDGDRVASSRRTERELRRAGLDPD